MALIYYYFGAKINGRKFAGFLEDKDVPFLSEFGLELDVRDVYTLITTKVPDPAVRRKKVFVGGHSMGGPFTAFFAGWDFDRNPATLDDAGYMNCAGLIGLDTVLAPTIPFLDVPAVEDILGVEAPSDTTPGEEEEYYAGLLDSIRKGYLPRMFPPLNVSPEMNALQELVAMEAAWHPDEESDLLFRTPYSDNIALNLHMLVCRNIDQFLFPIPSVRDFRYTNEALLGLLVDDNFQPINPLQASVGFINGGAVVERQFPLPQDWARLPELFILKNFINMEGQFSMNDAGSNYSQLGYGPVYTWANFDEIGNSTDPDYKSSDGSITYTTMGEEVSDIQDMARFLYKGPTNALEWYFATRANLDMVMALKDFGPKYGLTYFHGDKVPGMPQIDFITDKGPMVGQTDKLPPEIRILKGYNHLDVCIAAPDRPSRRPNELIDPILDFIMANNH